MKMYMDFEQHFEIPILLAIYFFGNWKGWRILLNIRTPN